MNRRAFLHSSLAGALAPWGWDGITRAHAQAPAAAAAPDQARAAASAPQRLLIDAYSGNLQWLRSADDVAATAVELTCGGVMPTVQPYPGHIDPAKVGTALPAFVKVQQKHGLRVKQVRGWNATDSTAPHLEAMLGTMAQSGVTHYSLGIDTYDFSQPVLPQLDAVKRKVDGFVKLNEKHGTTLMYRTDAAPTSIGGVVWDLLYILKDFNPKHVGFQWDTGHMTHHGAMWETLLRSAGPYVASIAWTDRAWTRDLGGLDEQGGPYRPPPRTPGAQGGGPPSGGGPGGGGPGGGGPGGGPGGRGGGRGGGGGRAFPLPLAGNLFARGGGWTSPHVPMGSGQVDIFRYAAVLREIGFDGPMASLAEYPNGDAHTGADTLTRPRIEVLGMLKRDVLTIRAAFQQSGTGLSL